MIVVAIESIDRYLHSKGPASYMIYQSGDNKNENTDYGFYSKNHSNCSICRNKCSSDTRCGAYECGGTNNVCAWWAVGQCSGRGSPNFFEYNETTAIVFGVTCWKGKSVL